jgi:hypothetical protein
VRTPEPEVRLARSRGSPYDNASSSHRKDKPRREVSDPAPHQLPKVTGQRPRFVPQTCHMMSRSWVNQQPRVPGGTALCGPRGVLCHTGMARRPGGPPGIHRVRGAGRRRCRSGRRELERAGFELLHPARTEPWGQTVARLLTSDGLIVGISYAPRFTTTNRPERRGRARKGTRAKIELALRPPLRVRVKVEVHGRNGGVRRVRTTEATATLTQTERLPGATRRYR